MLRLTARTCVICILSVFGVVQICSARIVTVRFTAEITDVAVSRELEELNEDLRRVAESILIGDLVEGVYAYDTSLPDFFDDRDFMGLYQANVRPCGIVVRTNEFVFQTNPEAVFVTIATSNDCVPIATGARDEFIVSSEYNLMTPQIGDLQSDEISLDFGAMWPGDPLSGDSLPVSAPILEDWDIRALAFGVGRASGRWSGRGGGAFEGVSFTATLTSAELLPDPAYVVYAKADAAPGGDGLSWSTAYSKLQDAIANAPTVGSTTIRVAHGTYRPDLGQGLVPGDREAAFSLFGGVTIQGGYAALEAHPTRRNPTQYPTILDGDLQGNDALGGDFTADNARHVAVAEGVNEMAVLDGCVIRGGCAQTTGTSGNGDASQAVDCNACGGALLLVDASPVIRACTFADNAASQHGGAVCSLDGNPQFVECRFENNEARESGGAVYARSDGVTGIRCVFTGNTARTGGAVLVRGSSTWDHCTLSANEADQGPALACLDPYNGAGNMQLSHCILRDGDSGISVQGSGCVEAVYSDVQGGWPGLGNIDIDPLFADPNSGDFHLKSQAGRWDEANGNWVQDDVTSPCIDAGDPNSPIGYDPFPNGGVINMGAYGGTAQASKSYFGQPLCETVIAGDINGDCHVDIADVILLLDHWLERGEP